MQYMIASHGNSTIGGIEYNEGVMWRRQKREKVSHRLGVSTGYGDAHQLMSMRGVGIAMQWMH